jgi:hypothetical protein
MERTSKPIIAGILEIIAGVLGLLAALSLFIVAGMTGGLLDIPIGPIPAFVSGIIMSSGIVTIVLAILSLIGGIFALQRKMWGLVLAGSIGALLTAFLLGIPAIILTAISKKEFK